jgi:hypothetical protein
VRRIIAHQRSLCHGDRGLSDYWIGSTLPGALAYFCGPLQTLLAEVS